MSLGSSGNATIRRPRDGSLRCGVYRVEIVAVDTFYRAGDSRGRERVQVDGAKRLLFGADGHRVRKPWPPLFTQRLFSDTWKIESVVCLSLFG